MKTKKTKRIIRIGSGIALIFAGCVLMETTNIAVGLAPLAVGVVLVVLGFVGKK